MRKSRKYIVSKCLPKTTAKLAVGSLLLKLIHNLFFNIKYKLAEQFRPNDLFIMSQTSSAESLYHLNLSMGEIINIQQLFNESNWKNVSSNSLPIVSAYIEAPNLLWYDEHASIEEEKPRKIVIPLPIRQNRSLTQY